MNRIFAAALEIQELCRAEGWRFCFIGAVAVQKWGEPRLTRDVDLTILTGFGAEERFVDRLLEAFASRISDARLFALRQRVLLLSATNGVPIDVSLGATDFEERAVQRSSAFEIGAGASLQTCGAEDLVVLKAFAGREQDWLDVQSVATRQVGKLDEALILRELEPLLQLKEDAASGERLRALLARARS